MSAIQPWKINPSHPRHQEPSQSGLPAANGAARRLSGKVTTRDGFDRLAGEASLPMVLSPLGRSAPRLEFEGIAAPDLMIWSVRSPTGFESVPQPGLDLYSIRVPLRGRLIRRTKDGTLEGGIGEASLLSSNGILATRFEPGSEVLSCALPIAALQAHQAALGGPSLRLDRTASSSPLPMQALVHTIGRLAEGEAGGSDTLSARLLRDLLMNQILAAWPRREEAATVPDRGAALIAARSRDFIEAHLGEPITVSAVAEAAGVSVRSLQASFRAEIGQTPVGYILKRRLERAHADLLANQDALLVSQIAYRWGFSHMSDFSRRYRERYGVSPSETGRRGGR